MVFLFIDFLKTISEILKLQIGHQHIAILGKCFVRLNLMIVDMFFVLGQPCDGNDFFAVVQGPHDGAGRSVAYHNMSFSYLPDKLFCEEEILKAVMPGMVSGSPGLGEDFLGDDSLFTELIQPAKQPVKGIIPGSHSHKNQYRHPL